MSDFVRKWQRVWIMLAVLPAAAALVLVATTLFPHPGYVREMTVAGGVLTDANKLRDVMVVPLAVLLQLVVIGIYVALPTPRSIMQINALIAFLCLVVLVAAFWRGRGLELVFFGVAAATVLGNRLVWKQDWQAMSGWQFLIAAAGSLLFWHIADFPSFWTFSVLFPLLALCAVFAGSQAVMVAGIAAIIPFSVVVFLSAPGFWLPSLFNVSWLDACFAAVTLGALVQAGVAVRSLIVFGSRAESSDVPLPAPPAFSMALALALLCVSWPAMLTLPKDDYHFGETLLAYQAVASGNDWFVDFLLPHGFYDALPGIVALMAGNDAATNIFLGSRILVATLFVLVQWRLIVRLGPANGLLVGLLVPAHGGILVSLLILLLVTETSRIRRPLLAGACAAVFSAAGFFLYGGIGTAVSLAGGTGALCLHALRGGRRAAIRFISGGLVITFAVATLAWPQLQGQLAFLRTSAAANLTIYGNGDISVLLGNPHHLLFALGPLLVVPLAVWGRITGDETGWRRLALFVALALPVILLAVLLNSYALARLDGTAPRAYIASCVVLAFLPVWLTCFKGHWLPDARVAAACGLLLVMVVNSKPPLMAASALLPAQQGQAMQMISPTVPKLGIGRYDQKHVLLVEKVARTVDTILEPDETFLNLTNRNALHYYLDRPAPVPIPSTYNSAPLAFQGSYIKALGSTPPPLAIIWADNIEHDGISLPLRAYHISRYVMAHYLPFMRDGYVFGIRNDLKDRLARLANEEGTFHLSSVTDKNWSDGIAIGSNADRWSIAVQQTASLVLRPGDTLLFFGDVTRKVVAIMDVNVLLDRPLPATAKEGGGPVTFRILNRQVEQPEAIDLWAIVFHRANLSHIPSAWGRSEVRLSKFMEPVAVTFQSAGPTPTPEQKNSSGDGPFRLDDGNQHLVLRIKEHLNPREIGILAFRAACAIPSLKPGLAVYWRSGNKPFSNREHLAFRISYERNLVPLDSSPLWSLSGDIQEIRIDLRNPELCGILTLSDIQFLKRRDLTP